MTRNKRSKRDQKGQFQPGTAPGPGRPAGSREYREALRRACSADDVTRIVWVLRDLAFEGDTHAARLLLDRVLGRPREAGLDIELELPDLSNASQVAEAVRMVVRAVAAGNLSATDGRIVVDLLASVLEAGEVETVLKACEVPEPWRRN